MANPKPKHQFQPGNQAAKGADHSSRKMITQRIISTLNEEFKDWDPKAKRFKSTGPGITKLQKMVDNLIFNATVMNDNTAIREVLDRVEGKPVQGISGPEGEPLEATTFVVRFSSKRTEPIEPDAT